MTTTTLDGAGRWVKRETVLGPSSTYVETREFDGELLVNSTQSEGAWLKETATVWDDRLRPTLISEKWGSGAARDEYTTTLNWAGGRDLKLIYNWAGAPNPHTVKLNGMGAPVSQTLGSYTDEFEYDAVGRKVKEVLAGTAERKWEYGTDGRLTKETFGTEVTGHSYTARGLLERVTHPDTRQTFRSYTKRGQVEVESYGTIPNALPGSGVFPGAQQTKFEYDFGGAVSSVTEGFGSSDAQMTKYFHNPRGDLTSVEQPTGTFTYAWDAEGRLAGVTPPAGSGRAAETFEYDALGRQTQRKRGTATWDTTWVEGVAKEVTPTGNLITSHFDGRGRTRRVVYGPAAGQSNDVSQKEFFYDGFDAVVKATETRSSGTTTDTVYAYDAAHLLASVTRGSDVTSYGYRSGGGRNVETETSRGTTVTYGYDAQQRMSSVSGAWGSTVVVWEPGGQRLKSLTDALVTETFGYDNRGRLESVVSMRGAAALSSVSYAFDGRGNRVSETQLGGAKRLFGYDTADRLTAWTEWDGSATALKLRADGSRDEEKQYLTPGTPPTGPPDFNNPGAYVQQAHRKYGYDLTGALASISNATTSAVITTYVHDADGRRISETPGRSYQWNVEGRLTSITETPTSSSSHSYDAMGLRRTSQSTVGAATTVRNYTWAGANGESEVAAGNDRVVTVGGMVIAQGAQRFSHDGLGSVLARVDSTGVLGTHKYGVFGGFEPGSSATPPATARYTNHAFENQTLVYAQQRWMDTSTGSLLSQDPLRGSLTNPNSMATWAYANGNAMRFTDPDGRRVCAQSELRGDEVAVTTDPKLAEQLFNATNDQLCEAWDPAHRMRVPLSAPGGVALLLEEPEAAMAVPNLLVIGGEKVKSAYTWHLITPETQSIGRDGNAITNPAQVENRGVIYGPVDPWAAAGLGLDALTVIGLGAGFKAEQLAIRELASQRFAAKQGGNWVWGRDVEFLSTKPTGPLQLPAAPVQPPRSPEVVVDTSVLLDLAPKELRGTGLVSMDRFLGALGGRRPVITPQVFREFVTQARPELQAKRASFLHQLLAKYNGGRSYVTHDASAQALTADVEAARAAYRGKALPRRLGAGDAKVEAEARALGLPVLTNDVHLYRALDLVGRRPELLDP